MSTVGSIRSVTTDAHINQVGIDCLEIFVTNSESLNCTGSKVLNDHVGSFGKLFENRDTLFTFEIDNE